MSFKKINELDSKKALIMLGFISSGLAATSLAWLPTFFWLLGANALTLTVLSLSNPLFILVGMFYFPAVYLQILKFKNQWPMQNKNKFYWHPRDLLADLKQALESFNDYLPIRRICIILGFLLTLMAPWYLAFLGPFPTANYALFRLINLSLCLSTCVLLPMLYFQYLKKWQIWPMNKVNTPFSLSPRVLYTDMIKALRTIDWKLLLWASRFLLDRLFPQMSKYKEQLNPKNEYPAPEQGWKEKGKWWAKKTALFGADFFSTLFFNQTWEDLVEKTPKNVASYLLFSVGIREALHMAALYLGNKKEIDAMPKEKRNEFLAKDLAKFNFYKILFGELPAKGLFETIYTAVEEENLVPITSRYVLNEFSAWKKQTKARAHNYINHKLEPIHNAVERAKRFLHLDARVDEQPTPAPGPADQRERARGQGIAAGG